MSKFGNLSKSSCTEKIKYIKLIYMLIGEGIIDTR